MAAFRLLDQLPQYRDALGNICAGGSLTFSNSGGSTPRNVYSDDTLGTSLGAVITLDADGRHSEDVWLSGEYRVILKDGDDVTVWQRDNVRDVATGGLQPPDAADADDGQALFTDGTEGGWYFDDVLTIPSQTGHAGEFLTTDGEALSWDAIATYDADNLPGGITATPGASGSVVIGGVRIQWGADTAPTATGFHTSKAVTFGTAFSGAPTFVGVTPKVGAGVTNNSPADWPLGTYTSETTTGFTAHFHCPGENEVGAGDINVTSSIPFTWLAIGPA
jgi:hypothetical protein